MSIKYVAEVLHHEEEQLVSIVMDYKTAAKVKWLVNNVKWNDPVGTLYDQLYTAEVNKFFDMLCEEKQDLEAIDFPDMGEW